MSMTVSIGVWSVTVIGACNNAVQHGTITFNITLHPRQHSSSPLQKLLKQSYLQVLFVVKAIDLQQQKSTFYLHFI